MLEGRGRYTGMDLKPGEPFSVAVLRHNASSPPIAFIVGRINQVPIEKASIDTVLCTQVLEHIPDDEGALREIRAVLRPGGRAVIAVPTGAPPVGAELDYAGQGGHVRHGYSFEALSAKLARAGLEVGEYAFSSKLFARALLGLLWFSERILPLPAVLMNVARIDDLFGRGRWFRPANLIVLATKRREPSVRSADPAGYEPPAAGGEWHGPRHSW